VAVASSVLVAPSGVVPFRKRTQTRSVPADPGGSGLRKLYVTFRVAASKLDDAI
jgi:hypothetical protein